MEEEKYKCKLCFRVFKNGRALGGHMKSHLVNLPICPQKKKMEPSYDSSGPELEQGSSVSDTSPEEDVAVSLMMLSRDTWHFLGSVPKLHKCDICLKEFKSTQALGGHRTSHKKKKVLVRDNDDGDVAESVFLVKRSKKAKKIDRGNIHECPICYKVFGSGQALGGHKRSHFLISPVAKNVSSFVGENSEDEKSVKLADNWIDLNMPAPMEDDEISQAEISAVSVAEFVNYG